MQVISKYKLKINEIRKFVHSKNSFHNITNFKTFIDPFNCKNFLIPPNNQDFHIQLKIDNAKFPISINVLEITCDNIVQNESKNNIDQSDVFEYSLNDNIIMIESKKSVDENKFDTKKTQDSSKKQLQLILKISRASNLEISLYNSFLRIHNSTHFLKHETAETNETEMNLRPVDINPKFSKLSIILNRSEVILEKFDHKFIDLEYLYFFKLQNKSVLNVKKLFVFQLECDINSSQLHIDRLSGYKILNDSNYTRNKVYVDSQNSILDIKNFINCGLLEFKSDSISENHSNSITVNNFSSNSFNIQAGENDKLVMNVFDMTDNSYLNYNKTNSKFKINPFVLCSLNVFNTFSNSFMSFLQFGKDGYIFCPTIVLNTNEHIKSKEIIGWNMINFKHASLIVIFLFLFITINSFTVNQNVYSKFSQFKYYQLFLRQTVENYANKKDN